MFKKKVVPLGLEPRTHWLWVSCSNRLSYGTSFSSLEIGCKDTHFFSFTKKKVSFKSKNNKCSHLHTKTSPFLSAYDSPHLSAFYNQLAGGGCLGGGEGEKIGACGQTTCVDGDGLSCEQCAEYRMAGSIVQDNRTRAVRGRTEGDCDRFLGRIGCHTEQPVLCRGDSLWLSVAEEVDWLAPSAPHKGVEGNGMAMPAALRPDIGRIQHGGVPIIIQHIRCSVGIIQWIIVRWPIRRPHRDLEPLLRW